MKSLFCFIWSKFTALCLLALTVTLWLLPVHHWFKVAGTVGIIILAATVVYDKLERRARHRRGEREDAAYARRPLRLVGNAGRDLPPGQRPGWKGEILRRMTLTRLELPVRRDRDELSIPAFQRRTSGSGNPDHPLNRKMINCHLVGGTIDVGRWNSK